MRLKLLAVSVALTACGGDAFAPETLTGTYALASLDGQSAPVVINNDPANRVLWDATLTVAGGSWTIDETAYLVTVATNDTATIVAQRLASGSWAGTAPDSLTFIGTGPGGSSFSGRGTFEEGTRTLRLTISGSALGSQFVFVRASSSAASVVSRRTGWPHSTATGAALRSSAKPGTAGGGVSLAMGPEGFEPSTDGL